MEPGLRLANARCRRQTPCLHPYSHGKSNVTEMEKHLLYPTEAGTPQRGICSPVLANMALDGLERASKEVIPPTTRRGKLEKIHLVRYTDDFIISGASKEILEQKVKPLVEGFLRERGLELSQEKTIITHIEKGFDFLGQNVRKYQGKLLIKPARPIPTSPVPSSISWF
jgi:RNA-directed DNA polymerase